MGRIRKERNKGFPVYGSGLCRTRKNRNNGFLVYVVDYVENSKGFLSRKLERHETLIKGRDLHSKIKSF